MGSNWKEIQRSAVSQAFFQAWSHFNLSKPRRWAFLCGVQNHSPPEMPVQSYLEPGTMLCDWWNRLVALCTCPQGYRLHSPGKPAGFSGILKVESFPCLEAEETGQEKSDEGSEGLGDRSVQSGSGQGRLTGWEVREESCSGQQGRGRTEAHWGDKSGSREREGQAGELSWGSRGQSPAGSAGCCKDLL